MKKNTLLILVVIALLLLGTSGVTSGMAFPEFSPASVPLHVNQTQVFQQGLNGYLGGRDAWVSDQDWDNPPQHTVNYGQNEIIRLSRDGGDNPLLYFDLTSVPTNSAVVSATLSLYNLTPGLCNQPGVEARRIEAFQVLADWDEGNQVQSPIDAPGKHGVTGDNAFDYYPGGGTDVPWGARGMLAGTDFAAARHSYAEVLNEGWYHWDVTALARSWVRGEQPNDGLTLRDATGYSDNNCDWRDFISNQGATAAQRPMLTIVYNPDVPYANAGPDQVNLTWNGNAITLDGSASHDRPGGNNATLTYAWRIAQPAFGSALSGNLPGAANSISFTPDIAGEWDIELTVTNDLGESATDSVHLRLLSIPAAHPRIYLTPENLPVLQARAVETNPRWVQLRDEADTTGGDIHAQALVYQLTGQASYCDNAIAQTLDLIASAYDYSTRTADIALVYDWCYPRLSAGQRTTFLDYFNAWAVDLPKGNDAPGWGNYWPRWGFSYAMAGLAAYGDTPNAQAWLDEFRYNRFRDVDLPLLDHIAEGGGWPEGMVYDWIANHSRTKALEAWRTATGENLFASTGWFRQRFGYFLLHRYPGTADQWGYLYHPYVSTGDSERLRGSMANYERIMAFLLIQQYPQDALAQQLQAYLSAPPTDSSLDFLISEEFLWYNPAQPSGAPALRTHSAAGIGAIFMRSGWPSGAADTDTSATYITFQTGDHYAYHQHFDQNSFTLFKYADLALDSGVYSGDGLSYHDQNYYVRTIAHNTLIVYNPAEDFSHARPDAVSNDGGQRTVYPGSRSPSDIDYFNQYATQYETGNIPRFEDAARYTYVLGDATAAYNNPAYNQAMNTSMAGNVAKVTRFLREFVYLRPEAAGGEYVLLYDRVGVTQAAFSGANTKLLFHVFAQPTVNGTPTPVSPGETLYTGADQAIATVGTGRLFLRVLAPAARNLRVVGERGQKAFWVFGENYDWHWDPGEPQPRPISDFEDVPYGEWRIELEPADAALDHNFLTVLYPTANSTAAMPATILVNAGQMSGAHIADPALNRVTLFSAAADGTAPSGPIIYTVTPTTDTLHLLVDLTPGERYDLAVAPAGATQTITLTPNAAGAHQASSQGVLTFTLDASGTPVEYKLHLPLISRQFPNAMGGLPPASPSSLWQWLNEILQP